MKTDVFHSVSVLLVISKFRPYFVSGEWAGYGGVELEVPVSAILDNGEL